MSLLLLILAGCSPGGEAPSVLLITLDTTRADRLGAYGYALAETPTLDGLAEQGTRFERAYTNQPLTIPAHSSIMTGRAPPSHGVRDNGDALLGEGEVTLAERFAAAGYHTAAFTAAFPTQAHWGFGQGFALYHDPLERLPDQLDWRDDRPADEVVDDAIESLSEAADGSVFAWVHLFDAHWPYAPPEPWASTHGPDASRPELSDSRAYDGEIAFMDAQLARLLEVWDDRHPDNIVLVTADHGEGLGDGGEQTHGFLLHDATLRVPLILRAQGSAQAAMAGLPPVDPRVVSHLDIAPTLVAMAGLPPSPQEAPPFQGQDLRGSVREEAYSEALTAYNGLGLAMLRARTGVEGRFTEGAWSGFYPAEGADVALRPSSDPDDTHAQAFQRLVDSFEEGAATPASLDPDAADRLAALGYLGGGGAVDPGAEEIDPRDVISVIPLTWQSRLLLSRGSLDEAERAIAVLEQRLPLTRGTRLLRAYLRLERGDVHTAWEELVGVYVEHPESSLALRLARLCEGLGWTEEAEGWFEDALALHPRSAEAMAGRVRIALQRGEIERATEMAEQTLLLFPNHAEVRMARAAALLEEGRVAEATEEATSALPALTSRPDAWLVMSSCLWEQGEADAAIEKTQEALRLEPWQTKTRLILAERLLSVGRLAEAWRVIDPAVRLLPDHPLVLTVAAAIQTAIDDSSPRSVP